MLTLTRNTQSWQPILADLALILFLVTAAALSASGGLDDEAIAVPEDSVEAEIFAPAQALYRPGPGLPTLAEWLERQRRDPRAALTIVAEHAPGDEENAWAQAKEMASTASALGVRSRVVIRQAKSSAVHASLGYDQPIDSE